MNCSNSNFSPKQHVKICRSTTVQNASSKSSTGYKYRNDRASSTAAMDDIVRYVIDFISITYLTRD